MSYSKKVKAIFRGQNGSCGFQTNQEYTLEILHEIKLNIRIDGGDGKHCDYQSLISFLENWDNIRNI